MSKETSVKISYGMFISCIVIVLHHSVGDVFYDVGIWGGVIEYLHEGLFSCCGAYKHYNGSRFNDTCSRTTCKNFDDV